MGCRARVKLSRLRDSSLQQLANIYSKHTSSSRAARCSCFTQNELSKTMPAAYRVTLDLILQLALR